MAAPFANLATAIFGARGIRSRRHAIPGQTQNGARFLGRENDIGTLAAGKHADLILIKGDPAAHIADIENVDTVFKDGVGYDSRRLIESVRGQVGIR